MPTDSPSHDVSMRIIRNFPSNTHTHTHTHTHRVAKLVSYFLYIVHIYTCIFYAVSKSEGFGVNDWVYDGSGTRYGCRERGGLE